MFDGSTITSALPYAVLKADAVDIPEQSRKLHLRFTLHHLLDPFEQRRSWPLHQALPIELRICLRHRLLVRLPPTYPFKVLQYALVLTEIDREERAHGGEAEDHHDISDRELGARQPCVLGVGEVGVDEGEGVVEFGVDVLSTRIVGRYREGRQGQLAANAWLEGSLGEVVPV